jgi:hypothetical protein
MTEKRDIKELIQQEETHLNNLLEPNDLKSFKGMVDELRDTWTKKQILEQKQKLEYPYYKIIVILIKLQSIGNVLENKVYF